MKFIFLNILSFGFFMVVSYAIYPHLTSGQNEYKSEYEEEKPKQAETVSFTGQKYDPDLYGPDAVARLKKKITGLEQAVDEFRNNELRYNETIDSLQQVATAAQRQAAVKREERTARKESTAIANSLLELDEDALAAILTQLNDQQLMIIYNAAGKLQQGKLLRSLDPGRAAQLLKKVIS